MRITCAGSLPPFAGFTFTMADSSCLSVPRSGGRPYGWSQPIERSGRFYPSLFQLPGGIQRTTGVRFASRARSRVATAPASATGSTGREMAASARLQAASQESCGRPISTSTGGQP